MRATLSLFALFALSANAKKVCFASPHAFHPVLRKICANDARVTSTTLNDAMTRPILAGHDHEQGVL